MCSEFSSRLREAFVPINIAVARSDANALIRRSTDFVRYATAGPRGTTPATEAASC